MELQAAYQLFGLETDATPADVTSTYRGLRKPILKELNRHAEGEEPPELVEQLESLETAFKIITSSLPQVEEDGSSTQGTGRTAGGQFVAGDVILERYEVVRRITLRPEGDTYRVIDKVRGAPVALKVLAPELVRDPKQRARLQRSLLAASLLNHPGVARVLSVLKLPHTYAVTQQIPADSENLWDLMYGEGGGTERLSKDVVLDLTRQAAHALAYVHTLTPHATLRPESLWLSKDGTVKVADVGFADVQRALRDKRQSRSKLGTTYWAPEQYRDDTAVGNPSDQYALALIVYEILSGKPSVGRTDKIRSFRKDYPQRFTQALERALASKAARRFESMDAFGEAALAGYTPERAAPAAVSRESLFVPALVMLAVFAGFVLSPIAKGLAGSIGSAVERWHAVAAAETASDLELRQLRSMRARLAARDDALNEAGRQELERVTRLLADPATPASERPGIQSALTSMVRQLVGTSRRKAIAALTARATALDALETTGRAQVEAAREAARAALPGLAAPDPAARTKAVLEHVRQSAAALRGEAHWRRQQAAVLANPAFASAYRALLEAEAALAIGDESLAEDRYDRAASALAEAEAPVAAAAAAVDAFDPLARPAGIATRLPAGEAQGLFDAWVAKAAALTDDAGLQGVLATLRDESAQGAQAQALVHDDGYWSLQLQAGARSLTFAGTWTGAGATRRLQVLVAAGRAVPAPLEVAAGRGERIPGLSDLRAMLLACPRDARSLWCARGPDDVALPKPAFTLPGLTVRSGQRAVAGRLPASAGAALVEARRFDVGEKGFDASVKVPGDVLVTWLRAHAARGMRTGPGSLLRVQVDGLEPRVHLLSPGKDATVEAGADVTVRVLVYDSTLTTLEVGGEVQTLRRDEVYKLIEKPMRAPSRGRLTLPIRAVDEAGNETVLDLGWDVR